MRRVLALVLVLAGCTHDERKISADRAREAGAPPFVASSSASVSASSSAAPLASPGRDPFVPGDAK